MQAICLNFQVHLPRQFRLYRFFDIGRDSYYFDDFQNDYLTKRSREKYLWDTLNTLQEMFSLYGDYFKASFTISGSSLDLLEEHQPEVLQKFVDLAKTGKLEFLATPYYDSLASLASEEEFKEQILLHQAKIKKLFGTESKVVANRGLIYNDKIGDLLAGMGFKAVLTEGAKHVLGWKSPNFMYQHASNENFKLLLRNFQLSDDIGLRFSNRSWSGYPLTADKFLTWLNAGTFEQNCLNLSFDCKAFGEYHSRETGIFNFLKNLPQVFKENSGWTFEKPSDLPFAKVKTPALYVPTSISWAREEKDLSLWTGNDLQKEAMKKLYGMEQNVKKTQNPQFLNEWRLLQNSIHFSFMDTKHTQAKNVYNPYHSPFDAFINYMNILTDFGLQVNKELETAK